jgi:magnesium transporter
MILIVHRNEQGVLQFDLPIEGLPTILATQNNLVWVDIQQANHEQVEQLLLQTFGFHPLAVDDALNEQHVPKVDDWHEYVYLVFRDVVYDPDLNPPVKLPEIDVFLGKNFVVTYHSGPLKAVDRVWQVCQRDERILGQGADHLLYRLIDEVATDSITAVTGMEEHLEELEDEIFAGSKLLTLEDILSLKRAALQVRRILGPQRDALNKLVREEFAVIDPKDRIFYRDLYDHMVRLYDMTDNLRDLTNSVMDSYLSVVNNRMNDVMKTLTILTALFLPLTFLTGFFGMNFFEVVAPLDVWTGRTAFIINLGAMISIPLGLVWWMRLRARRASHQISIS